MITAHRAKGLEFDHVVILNSGWDHVSKNEDPAAPRRLFYVAMTRARHSLTVLTSGKHPLMDARADTNAEAVLRRSVMPATDAVVVPAKTFQLPSLKAVDLSFAGRQRHGDPVHTAVQKVQTGDRATLEYNAPYWIVLDQHGHILGRMAKRWQPPEGRQFQSGHAGAIVTWRKVDSKEEFQRHIKRDEWETILPELVFVPATK
ncbi:ATP-dependent DNA helicase Rep [Ascidiaceihabitans donghaensis]|uniref:DNA 3'-5' helicase II n=1 Tax=Ascidiaceihabitans donghaensis TaxID=1510460 RepID=A0A2R8BI17_9RHOB|nr:ATP-dependent DNA helicase Rep [Ascidiaceihabitans donghaensis]